MDCGKLSKIERLALDEAAPDGRVLAFGSFHAAAQALRYLNAAH